MDERIAEVKRSLERCDALLTEMTPVRHFDEPYPDHGPMLPLMQCHDDIKDAAIKLQWYLRLIDGDE